MAEQKALIRQRVTALIAFDAVLIVTQVSTKSSGEWAMATTPLLVVDLLVGIFHLWVMENRNLQHLSVLMGVTMALRLICSLLGFGFVVLDYNPLAGTVAFSLAPALMWILMRSGERAKDQPKENERKTMLSRLIGSRVTREIPLKPLVIVERPVFRVIKPSSPALRLTGRG